MVIAMEGPKHEGTKSSAVIHQACTECCSGHERQNFSEIRTGLLFQKNAVRVFSIMFGCTHFFLFKTLHLLWASSKNRLRPPCLKCNNKHKSVLYLQAHVVRLSKWVALRPYGAAGKCSESDAAQLPLRESAGGKRVGGGSSSSDLVQDEWTSLSLTAIRDYGYLSREFSNIWSVKLVYMSSGISYL